MQRDVQRLHLLPKPVHFFGEVVGRHVVFGSPHGAGIGETDFAGALVGQFYEALVVLAHRRSHRVPVTPHAEQLGGVLAVLHPVGDGVDVQALRRVLHTLGARAALAVGALHPGGDAREFLALLGVRGSGQSKRKLEQLHLAP